MKARKDLENELRMAREASISIMENKEVREGWGKEDYPCDYRLTK